MSSSKPSASVISAGVVAILGSILAILGCALGIIGTTAISTSRSGQNLPAFVKPVTIAVMLFFMAVAVFGLFTGFGLFRLKNWARISALVWAGVTAFFGACTLLFTLFMPFPTTPGQEPISTALLKTFMFVFYGIPFGVGIWWLILFNRPGIRAQFSGEVLPGQPETPKGPRCPLPVAVVAGFLVFSFVIVLAFPLFGFPLPVILFGRMIHGPMGAGVYGLTALLSLAAAVGLLKLKRWSYPLILGVQLFWLLSGAVTFLSSSLERNMQQAFSDLHLLQSDVVTQMYLHNRSFPLVVGLVPSVLIFALLLYYRGRFREAADAAEKMGG